MQTLIQTEMYYASIMAAVFLALSISASYISYFVISFAARKSSKSKQQILLLLASILKFTILTMGLLVSLGTLGVKVEPIIAGLGLSGFAFGFALRDAISNMLAGILLIVYAPFGLDDVISVMGATGRVIDINLRYVTLQSETEINLIPNSSCFSNRITKTIPKAEPVQPGDEAGLA
jgi:small-conductance mechanosensitive channel